MNGLTMFFGVIAASILLFAGRAFNRPIAWLRAIAASVIGALATTRLVANPERFADFLGTPGQAIGFIGFLVETRWSLPIAIAAIALAVLGLKYIPRVMDTFADILLGSCVCALLCFQVACPLPAAWGATLIAAAGVAAALWHRLKPDLYLMATTSVVGGATISFLFTRFYFLPFWLTIVLAVLCIGAGWSLQNHSLKKQSTTQEKERKGEPV